MCSSLQRTSQKSQAEVEKDMVKLTAGRSFDPNAKIGHTVLSTVCESVLKEFSGQPMERVVFQAIAVRLRDRNIPASLGSYKEFSILGDDDRYREIMVFDNCDFCLVQKITPYAELMFIRKASIDGNSTSTFQ